MADQNSRVIALDTHASIPARSSDTNPSGRDSFNEVFKLSYDTQKSRWQLLAPKSPHTGVFVNGQPVRGTKFLKAGDFIHGLREVIGDGYRLHVQVPASPTASCLESSSLLKQLIQAGVEPLPRYKRVIAVMGAMIRPNGDLSPILKRRVITALEEFRDSWRAGVPTALVFSGGIPHYIKDESKRPLNEAREPLTEAEAMSKFASQEVVRMGFGSEIPHLSDHFHLEKRARDTFGNAYFVRRLLESKEFAQQHLETVHGLEGLDLKVVVEEPAFDRFGKAFRHVFGRYGPKISLIRSLQVGRVSADEINKNVTRKGFYNNTSSEDLDAMAHWLRTNHALYIGENQDFFFVTPTPPTKEAEPWTKLPTGPAKLASIRKIMIDKLDASKASVEKTHQKLDGIQKELDDIERRED